MAKIKISNHQIEKLEKQAGELASDIEVNEGIIAMQKKQLVVLQATVANMKSLTEEKK